MSENSWQIRAPRTILSWGFCILLVVKAFGAMPVRAAELHLIRLEDLSPVHGLHIQLAQTTSDKEKASGCLNLTRRSLHFQDNIYTLWLLTYKASFFILEGLGFPSGLASKVSTCSAGDTGRRLDSWAWKIPRRRAWQPTPVFWPGKFHG